MSKVCRDCGVDKPLSDFYAHPHTRDGRVGKCKVCAQRYQREFAAAYPARVMERQRKYRTKRRLEDNANARERVIPKRKCACCEAEYAPIYIGRHGEACHATWQRFCSSRCRQNHGYHNRYSQRSRDYKREWQQHQRKLNAMSADERRAYRKKRKNRARPETVAKWRKANRDKIRRYNASYDKRRAQERKQSGYWATRRRAPGRRIEADRYRARRAAWERQMREVRDPQFLSRKSDDAWRHAVKKRFGGALPPPSVLELMLWARRFYQATAGDNRSRRNALTALPRMLDAVDPHVGSSNA